MAPSSVVIKVKYGKTLRRFSALVNEDGHLDLDMERLRTKICSLFNFTPDADFTLTYVDEDDDQVTIADDEDLYDVMKQGLDPVRITVRLNVDKSAQSSAKSTGSSTPKGSSSQNSQDKNPCVTEILKSVPEPLCDVLSKLSHELASKAATTSPILADLINNLSKVGQSYLNASQSPPGTATVSSHEVHGDNQNTSATEKRVASVDEGIKRDGVQGSTSEQSAPTSGEVSVPHAVKGARQAETVKPPQRPCVLLRKGKNANSGHFHYMPMGDVVKKKEIIGDSAGKCKANTDSTKLPTGDSRRKDKEIKGDSAGVSRANVFEVIKAQMEKHVSPKKETIEANSSENNGFNWSWSSSKSAFDSYPMGECAFSGVPLQSTLGHAPYMPPPIQPFKSRYNDSADGVGSIFHKGVRCDGCGVLPITGPRFKSKIRHDYDLCSICISRMGNDADYARIDFPLPYRHPWTFKGLYDPIVTHLPTVQIPSVMRPYGAKHLRSRLDSRFIMDVNVMDGTLMAPSTPFTKIWRMRNNGTLPWVRGLQLLWIGGDRFTASDSFEIEIPVEGVNVGNEIDVAVDFIAPELPGRYISYWRMADSTGHKFGQRVWVLIQVDVSLNDSASESSPVLKPNLPSGNAGSPTLESSPVVDLNLPPGMASFSAHESSPVVNLNLDVNAEPTGDVEAGDLSSAPEGVKLSTIGQKEKIEIVDMNFPINDDLLVASGGGSSPITTASSSNTSPVSGDNPPFPVAATQVSYPEVFPNIQQEPASNVSSPLAASSSMPSPYSADKPGYATPFQFSYPVVDAYVQPYPASASPSISYPIIDMSEKSSAASSSAANNDGDKTNGDQVTGVNQVEENLLRELEEMGFRQVELNKEVLRMNEYDLERSVDELCGVSEWDPILEELQEMGFHDKATNRKLLVKNNGSIMRVVMDLVAGEKA